MIGYNKDVVFRISTQNSGHKSKWESFNKSITKF